MDRARYLLADSKLDKKYWHECIQAASYLYNRSLANTKDLLTPYEIFFNERPSVGNLRLYGNRVFVRIHVISGIRKVLKEF